MPELPSIPELKALRRVLLGHAFGGKADRQRQAVKYVFDRLIDEGAECRIIELLEIANLPILPGEREPRDPMNAASGLKRDINIALDVFYGEVAPNGTLPHAHAEARQLHYRVKFSEDGSYMPKFLPFNFTPHHQAVELIPAFWQPHLPPAGIARTLYVEPFFLIDEQQTYFRNSAMGTEPDRSALDYLGIPGKLKTGYSYVPAGIVKGIILLAKTLRPYGKNDRDFQPIEEVKPQVSHPPGDTDLIVLATPSSSDLVDTIDQGEQMRVDAEGVHFKGEKHNDGAGIQWGVVTRKREKHRIITMVAAKHGRSVEAMLGFLTRQDQLILLAQRMGNPHAFPETFQILFSMPVVSTPREGPSVQSAVIHAVYPESEPRQAEATQPGEAAATN